MKQRILTLSLVFLFAVATVFTGCKKDNPADPAAPQNPTVTLTSGQGFTSSNATVAPGTAFKFGFVAVPYSGSKIVGFKVTQSYDGGSDVTYMKNDTSNQSFTSLARTYTGLTRTVAGTEKYTVTVTDKNGQTASTSFTLTVKGAGAISTQTAKLIGAQGSTYGSFYGTSNGTVYKETDAKTNSGLVDFAYYYGANNMATLASVDDATVSGTSGLFPSSSTWTTKNPTKLTVTTMSTADFDAITDDTKLATLVTPSTSLVTKLTSGNVIAFETAAHKKGLIKIGTINGTTAGDITITVKVQQ